MYFAQKCDAICPKEVPVISKLPLLPADDLIDQASGERIAWGGGVQTTCLRSAEATCKARARSRAQVAPNQIKRKAHILNIFSFEATASIKQNMAHQRFHTAVLCATVFSCKVFSFSPSPNTWFSHHWTRSSSAGVTKQDERESQHKRQSTATYQDEAYEMFLSNIEKDMIESWKDQMERSVADEVVPSFGLDTAFGGQIQRNYDDDEDDDEEESTIATLESEIDGANSKGFLLSLSTSKLKERLREAGLPIEGSNKIDLVRRLLGVEGEPSTTKEFLSSLTSDQLRERLREAGLPITGQKERLVDRLLGNCK